MPLNHWFITPEPSVRATGDHVKAAQRHARTCESINNLASAQLTTRADVEACASAHRHHATDRHIRTGRRRQHAAGSAHSHRSVQTGALPEQARTASLQPRAISFLLKNLTADNHLLSAEESFIC
jgi:hypothetical protein